MTIYRSKQGKEKILSLYDSQIKELNIPFNYIYIDTSFGKTHLIETGNFDEEPLLVFHGGNSTTAYNLLNIDYLLNYFHIFAVDTIGHPGKSAEVSLSSYNYDYGKWASEVISKLGYESIACFSGSFGSGVLAKTVCIAPQKIKKALLYVPSGINNAFPLKYFGMLMPMAMFLITNKDKWLIKTLLPLSINEENIDKNLFKTAKLSIKYSKIKTGMPSNVDTKFLKRYTNPVLVMVGEKDIMFPASKVIERVKSVLPQSITYILKDRGHINILTTKEKEMILKFFKES